LDGFEASRPWSAPAAALKVQLAVLSHIPDFPTVQELDNKFDGWLESGNTFIDHKITTPAAPVKLVKDNIMSLSASIRTKSSIVANLIRSENRLFFIAYSQEKSQEWKEWKLAHVDFEGSLWQYPNCLQDRRFLMEFFIEDHRDKNLDHCNCRYWNSSSSTTATKI
jgi:hypothetical protein